MPLRMAAEGFANFAIMSPFCFYRLGTRNEQYGLVSGLHTATFDVYGHCLQAGMGVMT